MDEEILQDFLVEAGEIIEKLDEQLVQIEKEPDNKDLLNAIFRSFHTVKGGAGFLELTELVDICHAAENVFDMLRNGNISMSTVLMDAVLQAYDEIRTMFNAVQNRESLVAAPADLIQVLHDIADGKVGGEDASVSAPEAPAQEQQNELVQDIQSMVAPTAAAEPPQETKAEQAQAPTENNQNRSIDDITEDEFEALLDQLHGKGKAPGSEKDKTTTVAPAQNANATGGDEITEDEFEALLDQLHGKGKAPGKEGQADETDADFDKMLADANNKGTSKELKVASEDEFKKANEAIAQAQAQARAQAQAQAVAATADTNKATTKASPTPSASSATTSAKAPVAKAAAAAAPAAAEVETTVRVDTKVLDDIMNMVGELVLVRNRLLSIAAHRSDQEMSKVIANLDVVTGDLQGAVMKTRMQPIKKVFGRFPRVVRDLARKLGKKIDLRMEGEDTELDKNLVDALADPMVHMVRNCCDHGVELPEERVKKGKPELGTVVLSAAQQGDHILLSISDDGAGMDPEKLRQVAIRKGVLDEEAAARISDEEALNLIFAPGFSTNTVVTDISGRGVGMDVVKTNISKLNGSVRVLSKLNEGSTIEIKVPLTLAILPTLMISISDRTFALPLTSVSEIFYLSLDAMRNVDGLNTIVIRDKAVPLFFLKQWFENKGIDEYLEQEKVHIVLVQVAPDQLVGFVVDDLLGQEEVVIKPLDNALRHTPGMAGATVTSDGGIALILDIPSLIRTYAHKSINRF